MTYSDALETSLKRMGRWYKKILSEEQIFIWLDQVNHIPSEAISSITEWIIEDERFFPTPGTMKKYWIRWMAENPGRVRPERALTECGECRGTGMLIYLNPTGHEYSTGCAECKNWERVFPTRGSGKPRLMTKRQLVGMGMVLKTQLPC